MRTAFVTGGCRDNTVHHRPEQVKRLLGVDEVPKLLPGRL
jgi:hypothetical protein